MRYYILLIALSFSLSSSAQILNVESLRKVTDTSGFSGTASLRFALKRNTRDFLTIASNIHLQYKMKRHLILFKNDVAFQQIEGDQFENSLISHIRYNYRIHKQIKWEIFLQGQNNKVTLIDFRGLIGAGPRFKLSTNENYRFYLGTLAMYEYEDLNDGITPVQKDFRGSLYFSLALYPLENLSFSSTTYYQPKFSQLNDYRISSQSSLLISVFKKIAFLIDYTFTFDTFPAAGIPNSQFEFTTGLAYSFD
ncbi:MAG: putative salt-induced outer membrane protein YdiY [Sediminicola sp.]|jgi:putative salt-induced outer membrane protein YdiY|tara:strand:- start:1133 stop:1885 length:753 start_codon:yes stop_codon:yes gene_type:complete